MDTATEQEIIDAAKGIGQLAGTIIPGAGAIVPLVSVGLDLVEKIYPEIAGLFAGGVISAADQQAVLDRYNTFKTNLDALFSGPEWQAD